MNYRISESQAFANQRGAAFELLDDSSALDLRRGDWLVVQKASGWACDALHLLKSGEVVRMQWRGSEGGFRDGIEVTRADGSKEIVTLDETREMVSGYVSARLTVKQEGTP